MLLVCSSQRYRACAQWSSLVLPLAGHNREFTKRARIWACGGPVFTRCGHNAYIVLVLRLIVLYSEPRSPLVLRVQAKLLPELKRRVPVVADAWEDIKARIKSRNDRVKSKKEAAKAAAAAEATRIASIPSMDVSGDGGVLVQVPPTPDDWTHLQ